MTKDLFIAITNWQKETFGQATPMSKLAHLEEEIKELKEELNHPDKNARIKQRRQEFADLFILAFGAAGADGMRYEDIIMAIEDKFEINKARKWGKPDKDGVVKHVDRL